MTLLAFLRLAFIDQLKVMRQMHQVVVFKVVNWFLALQPIRYTYRQRILRWSAVTSIRLSDFPTIVPL